MVEAAAGAPPSPSPAPFAAPAAAAAAAAAGGAAFRLPEGGNPFRLTVPLENENGASAAAFMALDVAAAARAPLS